MKDTAIHLIDVAESKDPEGKITRFPFAYPIIIKELKKYTRDFTVSSTHLNRLTFDDLVAEINNSEYRIFGISGWSHNYLMIKNLVEIIKRKKENVVIVGGIIGGNDDTLMKNTETDIVATGADGEFILPEILEAINHNWNDLNDVKGITFRDNLKQEIVKTQFRNTQSKASFQNQEIPDYEYFSEQVHELVEHLDSFTDVPVKAFPLLTARGCPYACTYCGHLYGSKFLRKSWENWYEHIEHLINNYNVTGFYNHDTNMFLREAEIDEYCKIYSERKHNFKIISELRPTFGNFEMYSKLYKHGVEVSTFGFESGSEEMLERMKRPMQKMQSTRDRLKGCMDSNMRVFGNFVCGTPGESRSTLNDTRKFMIAITKWSIEQKIRLKKDNKLGTSGFGWTLFLPSPPSELYDLAVNSGVIKDEEIYLISLSDESNMRVAEGSKYKIALAQEAKHNINMSKFSSKRALLYYVKYTVYFSKFIANIYYLNDFLINYKTMFGYFVQFTKSYVNYLITVLFDKLRGKTGYMPKKDYETKGHYLRRKEKEDFSSEASIGDDKDAAFITKQIEIQNEGISV